MQVFTCIEIYAVSKLLTGAKGMKIANPWDAAEEK
tara:strand:+ start:333 stop:437 length:105 start_codon:yes stop_codon:yes gene_type:complete